ncbi:LysE family translocator [Cohaesibacter celericrescens]|uniref:LysE family translocator n=1 Tax=Cohaesibacter celericrescens TaxID=2067669 RepID=A0A2N5XK86_9HYPH|nr:LysE family translocator [Cohaesibacter celericrescens]PLW74926.1 hypothetical protein C0081_21700 [Cohaesibacter celericrescens]
MSDALLLFAVTEFFLSLSPGPAVLLIVSLSLNRGIGATIGAIAGILCVNLVYFSLSAVGVGAVIASSPVLGLVLKFIGCGYLAWTAFKIILDVRSKQQNGTALPRGSLPMAQSWRQGFFKGFLIQASSIKNIMIFVAIIPQFIDIHAEILPQMIALGIVSVVVEAPVLFAYGFAAYRLSRLMSNRAANALDLVSAALLIVVAGSVAMV